MQEIVIVLALGLVIGKVLRGQSFIRYISKVTLVGVAGLLFVMGAQIGSNPDVLSNLPIIGGKALIFAVFSILGAFIVSLPLIKRIKA